MPVIKKALTFTFTHRIVGSQRGSLLCLGLLWLLVQLICYSAYGIRVGADSAVYKEYAYRLLEGQWPDGRMFWYTSYISLLAGILALGGQVAWVVVVQMSLSALAALALWKVVRQLSADSLTPFLAVFLYIVWIKIHQWNIFIYTESVFTSLAILSFSVFFLSKRTWQYFLAVLLIIITFFVRPSGFGFLGGWMVYAMVVVPLPGRVKWIFVLTAGITVLLLLNFMLTDFVLVESYARGEIIYPGIQMGVDTPENLRIPDEEKPPLWRLLLFVGYQPWYFVKLCVVKLGLFFANVKPYFSLLHNALIVLLLYPLYALAIRGYSILSRYRQEKYFMLGFIGIQGFTVMLTTVDWDGRFLVPILPFIFILSAFGISSFIKKTSSVSRRGLSKI
ncbi:MAG: hypothetical protein ACLFUB_18610 [Cyclobacteriaceae bacterium]